jgi:hypothetical protein
MALALLQVETNLRPESGKQGFRAREELRKELTFLAEARKNIEALPAAPKRPWSKLLDRLYVWATEERLKI